MTDADQNEPNYFDLDKHRLDEEWLRQPRLYHQAASGLADARAEYERAKADRDLTMAELDRQIRLMPGEYGIEKLTETVVSNTILLEGTYKKALADYLESKHAMDVRQVEVDTLDNRKKALENLVQLQGRDYFASPKLPERTKARFADLEREEVFGKKRQKVK